MLLAAPELAETGGCLTPCEDVCESVAAGIEEVVGQGALATNAEGARAVGGPLGTFSADEVGTLSISPLLASLSEEHQRYLADS